MPALTAKTKSDTGRIYTRAMLVRFKAESWGNTVALPKEFIDAWAAEQGIKPEDARKYHKLTQHKIDPIYIEPVRKAMRAARGVYLERTAPWRDDQFRILSVVGFDPFKKDMRPVIDEVWKQVGIFEDVYPEAMERSKTALNGLAKHVKYPSIDAIRHEFSCGLTYREVPRSHDFRCDLDAHDVAAIVAENTSEDAEAIREGAKHAWTKAHALVQHQFERLRTYERVEFKDPKTGRLTSRELNGFHKTLVTNIEEFVKEILPCLNFMDDPELDRIGNEMLTELCRYGSDTLKADDAARETTILAAEDILKKMSAFI